MKMLQEILKEKGLMGHRLYIASGVPWEVLDMPAEELAKIKVELQTAREYLTGPTYLETGLPASIGKAIADYVEGEEKDVLHLDCL